MTYLRRHHEKQVCKIFFVCYTTRCQWSPFRYEKTTTTKPSLFELHFTTRWETYTLKCVWCSTKTTFNVYVSKRSQIQFEDKDHAVYMSFRWVTTTLSSLRTTTCDALVVPSEEKIVNKWIIYKHVIFKTKTRSTVKYIFRAKQLPIKIFGQKICTAFRGGPRAAYILRIKCSFLPKEN